MLLSRERHAPTLRLGVLVTAMLFSTTIGGLDVVSFVDIGAVSQRTQPLIPLPWRLEAVSGNKTYPINTPQVVSGMPSLATFDGTATVSRPMANRLRIMTTCSVGSVLMIWSGAPPAKHYVLTANATSTSGDATIRMNNGTARVVDRNGLTILAERGRGREVAIQFDWIDRGCAPLGNRTSTLQTLVELDGLGLDAVSTHVEGTSSTALEVRCVQAIQQHDESKRSVDLRVDVTERDPGLAI